MPPTLLVRGSLRGAPDAVPAERIAERIQKAMPEFTSAVPAALEDRVFVAKAETGSGKSTVLPARLFELLRSPATPKHQRHQGRSLLCTQPRVLTAMTLARDMASSPHYPGLFLPDEAALGGERWGTVGFQTNPITHAPPRGLIYATGGTLLAQLRAAAAVGDFSAVIDKYAIIIIDEAHERSLDTDAVLMLLKQLLLHGLKVGGSLARRLPVVILASATIEVAKYARYFELPESGANVFYVTGRQFAIETRWPATGTNDYIAEAVRTVEKIHLENAADPPAQRDVLVFLPGQAEMKKVALEIENRRAKGLYDAGGPLLVLAINREVINEEKAAFRLVKAPPAQVLQALETVYEPESLAAMAAKGLAPRRVIVSTVVAETGLTVETLRYVVDAGWHRSGESYQPHRASGLTTRPATQSRIKQRKGRAGRLFEGVFYPLYTRGVYESLPEQQLPEIVTEGASGVLLAVILAQQAAKKLAGSPPAFQVRDVDMLDPPPVGAFVAALEEAAVLGFYSPAAELDLGAAAAGPARGPGLTRMGQAAAAFPRLPPTLCRLLLSAPVWDCAASDLATVAAVCQTCGSRGLGVLAAARRDIMRAKDPDAALREALQPALREGLPYYLHAHTEDARRYLEDDLLEALCIFEAFTRRVHVGVQGDAAHADVESWCEAVGLDLEAMVQLAELREAALEEMVVAGLNPFWGHAKRFVAADRSEFAPRALALKRCFHDAFRLNRLELRRLAGRDRYTTSRGLPVRCDRGLPAPSSGAGYDSSLVTPAVVISAVQGSRRLRWELRAPLVSVLDTAAPELRVAADPAILRPASAAAPAPAD